MKETTNVSIAGIAFRLDNEGYLQLKNYLTRIELGYKNNPDGAEILADIEARVCELILNQQSADQLVPADRIRDIIEQLGMPDDFPRDGQYGNRRNGNVHRQKRRASERRKRVRAFPAAPPSVPQPGRCKTGRGMQRVGHLFQCRTELYPARFSRPRFR
ncbi:MAG: hypothetical protein ACLR8Y_17745 [Alistipes indistinctus]